MGTIFNNVFDMTRSLTGIEPVLEATTLPLGYREGGAAVDQASN